MNEIHNKTPYMLFNEQKNKLKEMANNYIIFIMIGINMILLSIILHNLNSLETIELTLFNNNKSINDLIYLVKSMNCSNKSIH